MDGSKNTPEWLKNYSEQRAVKVMANLEQWAVEFLKIEDPLSYHCPNSQLTANDLVTHYSDGRLSESIDHIVSTMERPPTLLEKQAKDFVNQCIAATVRLYDHFRECNGCRTVDDLLNGYTYASDKYRDELRDLFRRPHGEESWVYTVALLRANGYATFEDYIDRNSSHKFQL